MQKNISTSFVNKLEQLCKEPHKTVAFFAIFLMIFYTVQCTLLRKILGADVLAAFSCGAQGSWGNAQQPPLSGWLAYAISYIGNHRDWLLYLAAQCSLAIGIAFVYKTAKLFFDKFTAGTAALLCYFLFYYNPSETSFCAYTLEMCLVPVACYNFFKSLQENKLINWVISGITCAAGMLNKFSFALFIIAFAVIFFRQKKNLLLLKTFKPVAAVIIMLVLMIPYFKWLHANDFISIKCFFNSFTKPNFPVMLNALANALYPYIVISAVLLLVLLPDWRKRESIAAAPTSVNTFLAAIIPALLLVVLAFSGKIAMSSFASMASLTGIALISVFRKKIDQKFFTRIVLLLILYSAVVMIYSTYTLLCSSNAFIHSRPGSYTAGAINFYRQQAVGNIPLVVGSSYEVNLLGKYLPHHPPVCALDDKVNLQRYQKKMLQEGALLIVSEHDKDSALFKDFLKKQNVGNLYFARISYPYKSVWGKKHWRKYYIAYLAPQEISTQINSKTTKDLL